MRSTHLAIALGLAAMSAQASAADQPNAQMKSAVKALVGDQLRDGGTAMYRWPARADRHIYCGFVNAKNLFGAYVGFRPFLVMGMALDGPKGGGRYSAENATVAADISDPVVTAMCRMNGYDLSTLPPT